MMSQHGGAELFVSDAHGEHAAFSHVLRSGCGRIRACIDILFEHRLDEAARAQLATLVYYPHEKIARLAAAPSDDAWAREACDRVSALCQVLAESSEGGAEQGACAEEPGKNPDGNEDVLSKLEALCLRAQRLAVDRVHMLGDVYDRGPAPELIMDELAAHPAVDIQWGNHDVVWMGAALGQQGCIAHVVRNCARYGNMGILDAYGIDYAPLKELAATAYKDDPCKAFGLKVNPGLSPEELALNEKIQKAMAIIQFKVEAQLIDQYPSFGLEDRKLLGKIDRATNTVVVDGVEYPITDTVFPTVDPNDPYRLTAEEQKAIDSLSQAFMNCERLQRHIGLFLEKGSLYSIDGNMLLFHACVPLNGDGTLKEVDIFGETLKGKALFDAVDRHVRAAFSAEDPESRKRGRDLLWYLWLGQGSPLFAKSKMATFEIYYIADKAARKEAKNAFYTLIEDERVMAGIFEDFGMDPTTSRIVCGHVPVKVKDGEDPVKCAGRVLMIDGGMSLAYQATTGIAGFALVKDGESLQLNYLEPFCSHDEALASNAELSFTAREIAPL